MEKMNWGRDFMPNGTKNLVIKKEEEGKNEKQEEENQYRF